MKWSHLILVILLCAIFSPINHMAAQEATAEPDAVLSLGATYSTSDGHLSLRFPKNWVLQSFDSDVDQLIIRLSNDLDALKYFSDRSDKFLPGYMVVSVVVFDRKVLSYPNVDFDNTRDVVSLRKALPDVEPGWEYDKLTALTINSHPAVQTDVKIKNYADGNDMLIDLGDGLLAHVTAYTRPGELQSWNPLIQAIASSITYEK